MESLALLEKLRVEVPLTLMFSSELDADNG